MIKNMRCYPVTQNIEENVHSRQLITANNNTVAKPKYSPIKYSTIQQQQYNEEARGCFLCMYCDERSTNPFIQAIHQLFKDCLKTQNIVSVFKDMHLLYIQMVDETGESEVTPAFPNMEVSDFQTHFSQHIVCPTYLAISNYHILNTLRSITVNSIILKDNKTNQLKVDRNGFNLFKQISQEQMKLLQFEPAEYYKNNYFEQ
jgi:hypothetical protein